MKHIPLNESEHRLQRYRERQLEPPCEEEEMEEIEEHEEPEQQTEPEPANESQENVEVEKENDDKEKNDGNESDRSEKSRSSRSRSRSRSHSRSKSRSASSMLDHSIKFEIFFQELVLQFQEHLVRVPGLTLGHGHVLVLVLDLKHLGREAEVPHRIVVALLEAEAVCRKLIQQNQFIPTKSFDYFYRQQISVEFSFTQRNSSFK